MMIWDSCEIALNITKKEILHFFDDKSTAEVCFIAEPAYRRHASVHISVVNFVLDKNKVSNVYKLYLIF